METHEIDETIHPPDHTDELDLEYDAGQENSQTQNTEQSTQAGGPAKRRGPNALRPKDALTTCPGFINQVYELKNDDGSFRYRIKVGLVAGERKNEQGEWKINTTTCFLTIGRTLRAWAKHVAGRDDPYPRIYCHFHIRNLQFEPIHVKDELGIKGSGIIETITFGHLVPTELPS